MKKYLFFLQLFAIVADSSLAQTNLPAVLNCNEKLTLNGSPYIINNTITIQRGCQLTVDPGVEIKMAEKTHLIVKGKVDFLGTAAKPIRIHAKDTTWENIYLDSALKSTFHHVIIENARRSIKGDLQEPGALYGFFSTFEAKNCHFKNNLRCFVAYRCPDILIKDCILDSTNLGEKFLGQYCDRAVFEGNTLYYTHGDCDAVDFDASNDIRISDNYIYGGDDDGIDIGQCDSVGCDGVTINGNYIYNMKNKGVSNGELCKNIEVNRNVIAGCILGIGAKSGAQVKADHNTLVGNRLAVKSYHHLHQIWGPGNLTVTNTIIFNSDTACYVDPTAYLSVKYSLSDDNLTSETGNIMGNPMFVSSNNFHLTSASPAIDKGDPSFMADPDGSRSDIGRFYFGDPTGIKSNNDSNDNIFVYPNPGTGNFKIRLIPNHKLNQLIVQNTLGQTVVNELFFGNETERSVDLSLQTSGVYYVQIITENTFLIKKIVIH